MTRQKELVAAGPGEGAPRSFWYSAKLQLLGPPLVNSELGEQRLSKPLALGMLSPDGISSSVAAALPAHRARDGVPVPGMNRACVSIC